MEIEAAAEGGQYATIWSGTGLKTYRIVTANWQPTNVKRLKVTVHGSIATSSIEEVIFPGYQVAVQPATPVRQP